MSGVSCYLTLGARLAQLRKFAHPTRDMGQLAKICTGDLSGSGLRKYALRRNHTIQVYVLLYGSASLYPARGRQRNDETQTAATTSHVLGDYV